LFPFPCATYADICISIIVCLELGYYWYRVVVVVISGLGLLARARRVIVIGVGRGTFLWESFLECAAPSGTTTLETGHLILGRVDWDVESGWLRFDAPRCS
jgi:hypothetical protein